MKKPKFRTETITVPTFRDDISRSEMDQITDAISHLKVCRCVDIVVNIPNGEPIRLDADWLRKLITKDIKVKVKE